MGGAEAATGAGVSATLYVMGYNQEAHIRAAVASALAQDYADLEVVLSDDASADGTFGVMEEMAAAYDGPHRVILNRNPVNLGIVAHINRIVELSSGALIVQNAGDDVSDPDRVSALVAAWEGAGRRALTLYSPARIIDGEGRVLGETPRKPRPPETATPMEVLAHGIITLGATCAWSRELFTRYGPLPERLLVEDLVTTFRSVLGGGVMYLDRPLLGWRTGGLSWRGRHGPGHEALYGTELTYARWRRESYAVLLEDLARLGPEGREAMEAICRARHARFARRVALAEAGPLGRAARLPGSLAAALRWRDGEILKDWARYAAAPLYMRRIDARAGGS